MNKYRRYWRWNVERISKKCNPKQSLTCKGRKIVENETDKKRTIS